MKRHLTIGRSSKLAALVAITASGLGVAAPASAADAPSAVLHNGTVTVVGTSGDDIVDMAMHDSNLVVDFGFDGTVDARFPRSRVRQIKVSLGAGDDGLSFFKAGAVPLTVAMGAGNDGVGVVGDIGQTGVGDAPTTILGGAGNDNFFAATPGQITLNAGAGDDKVEGGGAGVGHETVLLGGGDDTFTSSLNDFIGVRNDSVDGGTGHNSLAVEGTFASETVALSNQAGHLFFTKDRRDTIDAVKMQDVTWNGFGGEDESGSGDTVFVDDLTGTDVENFTPDFSADLQDSKGDNSLDNLIVTATNGDDNIVVTGAGAHSSVTGLVPTVTPVWMEAGDTLEIDTLAGNDTVDSSGLQQGLFKLVVV